METNARVIKYEIRQVIFEVILPKGTTGEEVFELFRTKVAMGTKLDDEAKLTFRC